MKPVILALGRGDTSAIPPTITAVLIVPPNFSRQWSSNGDTLARKILEVCSIWLIFPGYGRTRLAIDVSGLFVLYCIRNEARTTSRIVGTDRPARPCASGWQRSWNDRPTRD